MNKTIRHQEDLVTFVCDCGQHYSEEAELHHCQAIGHQDSGYLEAIDALNSTPDEYRDEAWHVARAELEALR